MGNEEKTVVEPEKGKDTSAQVVEETAEAKATRLEAEKVDMAKQLEQWQKEAKAHQSNFTKANQELKRLREQAPRSSNPSKEVLGFLEEQFGADPRITALKETMTREDQMARQERIVQDARAKLETKIEGAGLSVEDERLDAVWDAFDLATNVDGKFERADTRLDRILSKLTPKKEEVKKEVNEEEIARRWMEQKKLLETDTGLPSGGGVSLQDLEKGYIAGTVSKSTYEEAMRKAGKL